MLSVLILRNDTLKIGLNGPVLNGIKNLDHFDMTELEHFFNQTSPIF